MGASGAPSRGGSDPLVSASPRPDPFGFASDVSKQLLTLASGVIALTVTFAGNLPSSRGWLIFAWVLLGLSIFGGCWMLLAMTGSLAAGGTPSINSWNIRLPALLQVMTFGIGLASTVVFGITAFSGGANLPTPASSPSQTP